MRLLAFAFAMGFPCASGAQSLLERTPNVSGNWPGASGTLYFHFVHRFAASDGPERKVSNVPTFLVAAGLPMRLLAGFNYSTNSTLAPRFPNEWELFARWMPLSEDLGSPVDLGAQVGYNNAADGVDAEASIAKKLGVGRVIVAARALSDPVEAGNQRFALAGGATVRLGQFIALAGDVGSLLDRDSTERIAWSAGFHFAIPLTPHTVSLHATNAMITTLQGVSRGASSIRYGFEFTIPLTLRRYFGRRAEQNSATDSSVAVALSSEPARNSIANVPRADSTRVAATPPAAQPSTPPPSPSTPQPRVESETSRVEPPRTATPSRPTTRPRGSASAPRPAAPRPPARVTKTSIKNVTYLQPRLQITVGTTVEWTNTDPMPHSVTAVDRSFDSGLINPGKTYRHTFTKAGTFSFFCVPHPFMKGTVIVKEP